jgi:hypothetical protein
MKIKLLLVLLIVSFVFTGCKNDFDVFKEKAEGFVKSDKHIDKEELEKLKSEVALFSNDRAFKRFYTADAIDENKLVDFLENQGWKVILAPQVTYEQDIINVYLENSGSMFGYVSGETGYKDALTELLVQLGSIYGKKNIHLYFINTKIYPIDFEGNVAQYPSTLSPNKFKVVGDINSSDINEIYRKIIAKTPEKTISILLSDCIYSASGDDTADKLGRQKSLTKDVFQDSDISTLVVKLNSAFNGVYYPKNNTKQKINQSRPYYISVLGSAGALGYFYNNVKFQPDFKGYEDRVFLSSAYNDQSVYHTLVTTHNSTGFRPVREFSDSGSVRGMEDITTNDRDGKPFTFSIAVDLISVPVEENVAINPLSYNIRKGDYKITGIERYNPKLLKSSSVNLINKSGKQPTHIINFSATTANYSDLEFELKNEIPQWVYAASTNDDTNVKNLGAKTFGFKYLIEGINEAHQTDAAPSSYFKINIKINH